MRGETIDRCWKVLGGGAALSPSRAGSGTRSTRSRGGHNKWRGASLRTTRIPFGTMNKERIAIRVAGSGAVDQLTGERGEGCCEQIELVIQCIGTMYHQL